MSLIRQMTLLVVVAVLLTMGAGLLVTGSTMRELLASQASIKNADNAQSLALAASQQGGDAALIELVLSAQFDTGHYQLLRWRRPDGSIAVERQAPELPGEHPAWLRRLVPLQAEPGLAQVSGGWNALGQIEIATQLNYAYDALWQGLLRALGWALLLAVLALLAARAVLARIRRPLDRLAGQAASLAEGQFTQVPPSKVSELRPLTEALNGMVSRIERMFAAHAEQLGLLRQQAHCDALTGLSLRQHFMAELASALARDDGPARAGLLLLRLQNLQEVNRQLGRAGTDRVLVLMAEALHPYTVRVQGALAGRLNGADFALWLPADGVLQESAEALAGALHGALQQVDAPAGTLRLALGGAELACSHPLSQWFALADGALAEAEQSGAQTPVLRRDDSPALALPQGEGAWRAQIEAALAQQQLRLLQYPVLDRAGRLLHWECPLHLGLAATPGAVPDYVSAQRWLPLAQRTGLMPEVDLAAVAASLQLIAGDGQQRAVNLAQASLQSPGFLARLVQLLRAQPQAARQLALEFDVRVAQQQFEALREFGRVLHPLGVRLGLEHAGQELHSIERLPQLALDFVKLDRAVLLGVAEDAARAGFVRSLVLLLQGQSLTVMGEGVESAEDAAVLWDCGLNGLTGPWVSAQLAA